jgi:hypothetical protein
VFKHDAKLKRDDDSLLSLFFVQYNQIDPMKVDEELEGADIAKEGYLTKTNTGSMFAPCVDCAVLVVYPTINHPAKITRVHRNEAEVRYDVCGSVSQVPTQEQSQWTMTFLVQIKGNTTHSATSQTVTILRQSTYLMKEFTRGRLVNALELSWTHFRAMAENL